MHSSATCATAWPVEVRLRPGRRGRLRHWLGVVVAFAAILASGVSGAGLAAVLVLLWLTARRALAAQPGVRTVRVDMDEVILETDRGRSIRLSRPPPCRLQPGVITLSLSPWRRAYIFSDQCSDEAFRRLRRLLSSAAGGG